MARHSGPPALKALGYDTADLLAKLPFETDNAKAVAEADLVQECGPEKPDFKPALWKAIEASAPQDALRPCLLRRRTAHGPGRSRV